MKKVFSVFLSLILILFIFSPCFSSLAAGLEYKMYENKTEELKEFSNELSDLIDKYDSGLSSADTDCRMKSDDVKSINTPVDTSYFQTARLIVYTDDELNDCNAAVHLSGYEDIHILQYETPEQAEQAYERYSSDKRIDSVEPDIILKLDEDDIVEDNQTSFNSDYDYSETPEENVKHSWGYDYIQTPDAFQYILGHISVQELPEVVVAVIDGGIGKGDEEFNKRLLKAYTFLGSDADPYTPNSSHGTLAAAVIYENTLPNVKFVSYQVFNKEGSSTTSLTNLAEEQAALDKVDIINSSYGGQIVGAPPVKSGTAAERIDNSKPLHIASAGNHKTTKPQTPACRPGVISVANLTNREILAASSGRGVNYVDVAAPGEGTFVSYKKGEYAQFGGTSCAAPYVVATSAMLMSYYPEASNAELAQILFDSCDSDLKTVRYGIVNMFKALTHNADDAYQTEMPQFSLESSPASQKYYDKVQYLELTCQDKDAEIYYTLNKTVPNKEDGILYTEPIELSKATTVYAVAYSKNGARSEIAKRTFNIRLIETTEPDENGWLIRENGMIYDYIGLESDLVVPETVLGIKVKGIEAKAFQGQSWLTSIVIPESISTIGERAFSNCNNLSKVTAPGITSVPKYAFSNCLCLDVVDMPKLERVSPYAFYHTGTLDGLPFEKLNYISTDAFAGSNVVYVHLDSAESVAAGAFSYCYQLVEAYLPKIIAENCGSYIFQNCLSLEKVVLNPENDSLPAYIFSGSGLVKADFFPEIIYSDPGAFGYCSSLTYAYLPSLEEAGDEMFFSSKNLRTVLLPSAHVLSDYVFGECDSVTTVELSDDLTYLGSNLFSNCFSLKYVKLYGDFKMHPNAFYDCCLERIEMNRVRILEGLPSTQNCIIAMPSTFEKCNEDTKGRKYKVYGTSGTYAETWAKENDHEFINISQDTAILKDVPMEYTDKTQTLSPDVVGFNRTYQWYANTEDSNKTGTPIEGATDREFNPEDYPAAKYYYCVVTSTDVGYDPIEIRTDITENMTLNPADYSKVEKAKSEIPENLSLYTNESVKALQDILDNIDYSLDETEQSKVDDYAKAIEEAINSLKYKPADYTEYNKAVEKANTLDRSLYQDLTALDNALSVDVKDKNITEQAVVDEQTKAIEKAINSLEYKPADYTEYNKAVEKANTLDRSLYQDLTALDVALNVDVGGKNITEQAVVDEQTKAIEEAINALEYKPADYSKLNSALAQVPEDLSIYTDESVKRLNSVIESLNYELNITQQDEADKQVEALLEAINSLEKRYILGDVNLDGEITILDAKWVLQNIVRLRSLGDLSLKAADMNQDGKITILDARLILFAVTR